MPLGIAVGLLVRWRYAPMYSLPRESDNGHGCMVLLLIGLLKIAAVIITTIPSFVLAMLLGQLLNYNILGTGARLLLVYAPICFLMGFSYSCGI